MAEVLAHRLAEQGRFLRHAGGAFKVHEQTERRAHRHLSRPADDERLGGRVEIPFAERRRIDRVEELFQLADADLDQLAVLRDGIAGRRFPVRRLNAHLRRMADIAAGVQTKRG